VGRGTWDAGRGTRDVERGTWGLGDVGLDDVLTRGRGDAGSWDLGTRGGDKQTTPDFCAKCVKYIFRWWIRHGY